MAVFTCGVLYSPTETARNCKDNNDERKVLKPDWLKCTTWLINQWAQAILVLCCETDTFWTEALLVSLALFNETYMHARTHAHLQDTIICVYCRYTYTRLKFKWFQFVLCSSFFLSSMHFRSEAFWENHYWAYLSFKLCKSIAQGSTSKKITATSAIWWLSRASYIGDISKYEIAAFVNVRRKSESTD